MSQLTAQSLQPVSGYYRVLDASEDVELTQVGPMQREVGWRVGEIVAATRSLPHGQRQAEIEGQMRAAFGAWCRV